MFDVLDGLSPVYATAAALAVFAVLHRHCSCLNAPSAEPVKDKSYEKLRPSEEEYEVIDMSGLEKFRANNAFHETLQGESKIENYEVYRHKYKDEVLAIISFGKALNGHPGIVHGGITSLAFDNTFGWLFMALRLPPAFTANLNINYRRKVLANSHCILRVGVAKKEGRKLFMEGAMCDSEHNVLADATALFISPKEEK